MTIFQEIISKILEMPGVADQIRQSLVNRDLSIEIDGKKYQIMKKRNEKELEEQLTKLKSRVYDLEEVLKELLFCREHQFPPEKFDKVYEDATKLMK